MANIVFFVFDEVLGLKIKLVIYFKITGEIITSASFIFLQEKQKPTIKINKSGKSNFFIILILKINYSNRSYLDSGNYI